MQKAKLKKQTTKQNRKLNRESSSADMIGSFQDHSKYIQHALFFQTTQALTILSFFSFLLLIVLSHLQPQADAFGDCCLRKCGLDQWHQFTCQRTSLRSNQVALLLDS